MTSAGGPQGPAQGYPAEHTRWPAAARQLREPAVRGAHPGTRDLRGQADHRRPGPTGRAHARRPARQGPRAARGRARRGQDAGGRDLRQGGRRHVRPHPVHPRPGAHRHRRHPDLPAGQGGVRHRARPCRGELPARRRDQPRPGQGAVRAAGGHGRAQDLDRRQDLPAARAVPGDGDPEPDRAGRRLRAARGAARPLPVQAEHRLPDARGRARDRLPDGRQAAGAQAGPRPR